MGTWSLGYSFIYVGERYNQQENIIYNHTQPWYTSDMTLMKEIRWGKARLRFTAEVNNLFDQDYDVILNYPMPMRNYKFGLAWNSDMKPSERYYSFRSCVWRSCSPAGR